MYAAGQPAGSKHPPHIPTHDCDQPYTDIVSSSIPDDDLAQSVRRQPALTQQPIT